MDAHLLLDNGVLRLEPLNFGVAGGDIRSMIRMDARETPSARAPQITARWAQPARTAAGGADWRRTRSARIGGNVALAGSGNSIAQMLGTSDGDVAIGMGTGQISNLLMELAGAGYRRSAEIHRRAATARFPIRCAFGDFGVATA